MDNFIKPLFLNNWLSTIYCSSLTNWLSILIPFDLISLLISLFDIFLLINEIISTIFFFKISWLIFKLGKFSPVEFSLNVDLTTEEDLTLDLSTYTGDLAQDPHDGFTTQG